MYNHIKTKLKAIEKFKATSEKNLEELKEVHSSNIKILDEIEEKILKRKTLEYDDNYKLQLSSRLETIIDIEVGRLKESIGSQTIDIYLVKKYSERYDYEGYERIDIGQIGFVIEDDFGCELKYIFIKEEYQNRGYGSYILKRLRGILNACYRNKREINAIWTNIEVIKSIEGKKVETISNKVKYDKIEKLLIYNDYEREKGSYINYNYGHRSKAFRSEFELLKEKFKERYGRYLGKSDSKYALELMDEIKCIANIISSNKYGLGDIDDRLIEIKSLRRDIESICDDEEFKFNDNISSVECIYEYINDEDKSYLELNEDDDLEIKILKLYCKEWNLTTVSKLLYEMGHKTKNKSNGEDRPYTVTEIGEIIDDTISNLRISRSLIVLAGSLRTAL